MIGYFLYESPVRWGGRTKGHCLRRTLAPWSPLPRTWPQTLRQNAYKLVGSTRGGKRAEICCSPSSSLPPPATARLRVGGCSAPSRTARGSRCIARLGFGPTVLALDSSAYGGKRNFAVSASRRELPFTSCLRPRKVALTPALCVSLCGVDPGSHQPVPSVGNTLAWGSRTCLRRIDGVIRGREERTHC